MGLGKIYLTLYNLGMAAGWSAILFKLVRHLASGGDVAGAFSQVEQLLVVCQTGAVMEIIHAKLKLVRSPVATTFLQVLSRLIVLYGSLELGSKEVTGSPIVVQMLTAWCLSEIIRYSFYAANLYNASPAPLTWLRYSAFMILYPVGITGEIGCLYNALPYIKEHKPYSVEMPNKWNFTFSWYNCVWFILLGVYPYGSYVMYTYMLAQRRKTAAKAVAAVVKKAE